jgi:hypothetical protein
MGSIAMNGSGDIALGYSVSSTTTYPSIRFTGRLATDPLGEMTRGEGEIIAGSGYQNHTSGRWGDYSSMSVDPTDDCRFWFTSEYYATIGNAPWQTRIGTFKLADCAAPPPPPPPPPPPGSMHVGDLDGSAAFQGKKWSATVTIAVLDEAGIAVSGATVSGSWSNGGTSSCTTDAAGTCSVTKGGLSNGTASVTFTVTGVAGSLSYDPGANTDPDGDSDGTSITVLKP